MSKTFRVIVLEFDEGDLPTAPGDDLAPVFQQQFSGDTFDLQAFVLSINKRRRQRKTREVRQAQPAK